MSGDSQRPWQLTLTNNRLLRFLLTNRYVQPTVHVVMVTVFAWAIWTALTGTPDPDANAGTVAFFGLWWSTVMLVSLLLIGRIWCYFCPMGAIVRLTQRFGRQRHFPMFTTARRQVLGISVSVVSITAVTFVLARLPMYNLGMVFTPRYVAYYFLAFTVLAVGVSLVFQRQAFCRYVCPATGVMSVTSKLSPFELRQDTDTGVQCATLEYESDYLSTDRRCVSCMKCTTQQPEEDVGLRVRWPGAAAVRQSIPLPDEALLVIVLWAVFPIDHVLSDSLLAVTGLEAIVAEPWADVVAYFGSITLAIGAYLAATAVGTRWSGLEWEASFTRLAYAYLPFSILYMVGNHVVPGFLGEGGAQLNVLLAGLGLPRALPDSFASESTIAAWETFNATTFPWIGVAWGLAIAWYAALRLTDSRSRAARAVAPHVVLLVASTAWVIA